MDQPTNDEPQPNAAADAPTPPQPGAPPEDDGTDGRIALYRLLVGLLFAVIVGAWIFFDHVHSVLMKRIAGLEHQLAEARSGMGPPPSEAPSGPAGQPAEADVPIIDVADRFGKLAKASPDRAEATEAYLSSKQGTVALKVFGREQAWPLHVRRKAEELAVVVGGSLDVKHVFPKDGKLLSAAAKRGVGAVFATPPSTGVEWSNASKNELAAALVFAVPPGDGSFFVRPEDERLQKGTEPFAYDPTDDLAKLAAGPEESVVRKLPVFGDRLSAVLVKTEAKLPRDAQHLRAFYVLRGKGTFGGGKPVAIGEGQLAVLKGSTPVAFKAEGGPVAALLFDAESLEAKPGAPPAVSASAGAKP